ncbi:hypothetical protein CPC08DRAFT_625650, partial [Agrocybe pediades]
QVEKSAFASHKTVAQMMTEMEDLYAMAFARGDKKRATRRLRAGNSSKSHHFSTFRAGAYIGIALPAFIDGLVKGAAYYYFHTFNSDKLSTLFRIQFSSTKQDKKFLHGVHCFMSTPLFLYPYFSLSLLVLTSWYGPTPELTMYLSLVRASFCFCLLWINS